MIQPEHLSELPADFTLSTLVNTSIKNNAIGFKNTTQLESLQSWVRQQKELYKESK